MGGGLGGCEGGMMMSCGAMGGGGGQYSCQSFMMSSTMGADGQMHTQQFSSSDVGNREQGIREAQQAYQNSASGMQKMAMERQLGDRGVKIIRERNRDSLEERSTELLRGLEESACQTFTRDFDAQAHYLPQHTRQLQLGGRGTHEAHRQVLAQPQQQPAPVAQPLTQPQLLPQARYVQGSALPPAAVHTIASSLPRSREAVGPSARYLPQPAALNPSALAGSGLDRVAAPTSQHYALRQEAYGQSQPLPHRTQPGLGGSNPVGLPYSTAARLSSNQAGYSGSYAPVSAARPSSNQAGYSGSYAPVSGA